MTRIKKQTVDFFYHPVKNGTRMYVMEQRFGDKGYVAYYKILEMLGAAEGHFLDFKSDKHRLFFIASIRTDEIKMTEIINTLVELESLDRDLWENHKIIWSQEFVDNLSDLYNRRKIDTPTKEKIFTGPERFGLTGDEQQKIWARSVVNKAIQRGEIKRLPCEICGDENSEAHHEDYSDPLNVQFLCRKHHSALHKDKKNSIIPLSGQNEYILPHSIAKDSKEKDSKEKQRIWLEENFKEVFDKWMRYKADRREKYKSEESEKEFFEKLKKYSGGNPKVAEEIVKLSMSNNWAGIFELKNNGKNQQNTKIANTGFGNL